MGLIENKVIEIIQEKYEGNFSLEDLVGFCFDAGIIDIRRCEIAFVKKHYYDLMRENPAMKAKTAKELTAEKFCISESKVENCLYYFKSIKF